MNIAPEGRAAEEVPNEKCTSSPSNRTAAVLPARPSFSMSAFFKDSDVTVYETYRATEASDVEVLEIIKQIIVYTKQK